jgi:uncharacterized cupin superfamily protein
MTPGMFKIAVLDAPLQPDPLDPAQIVDGDPVTSDHVLFTSEDGLQISGVWSCSPGVFTDVEVDETFVVIRGTASVQQVGGETIELAPGDMGVLKAGTETIWTVYEELVKGYHLTLPAADTASDA